MRRTTPPAPPRPLNPLPWRQGVTLLTHTTRTWTAQEMARSDRLERCRLFSGFKNIDQGKSRITIADFRHPEDLEFVLHCIDFHERFDHSFGRRDGRVRRAVLAALDWFNL